MKFGIERKFISIKGKIIDISAESQPTIVRPWETEYYKLTIQDEKGKQISLYVPQKECKNNIEDLVDFYKNNAKREIPIEGTIQEKRIFFGVSYYIFQGKFNADGVENNFILPNLRFQ